MGKIRNLEEINQNLMNARGSRDNDANSYTTETITVQNRYMTTSGVHNKEDKLAYFGEDKE